MSELLDDSESDGIDSFGAGGEVSDVSVATRVGITDRLGFKIIWSHRWMQLKVGTGTG